MVASRPRLAVAPTLRPPAFERRCTSGARGLAALAALLCVAAAGCGGSFDDRLGDARTQQEAGLFEDSIAPLRELLREQPGHPEASYRLGVALVRTARPSLALPYLQQAARSDAFGVEAGLALAETHLGMRNEEEALRAASAVLERDPAQLAALTLRAQAELALSRYDDLLADADALLEREPEGYRGLWLRAVALQKLERLDEAEAQFERLAERFAEGDPKLAAQSCFALAGFYGEGREDAERARTQVDACLEQQAWDPAAVNLAVDLLEELEQTEAATAALRRAVEAHPEAIPLRARLGQRLAAAGEKQEARELLAAAARESGEPKAYTSWAQLLREDDAEAALAALDEGLEQAYGDLEGVRYLRADVLVDLERLDDAEQALAAIEEPELRDHVQGRILLARGQPAEALEVLERSIARFPNNAGSRLAAAKAAIELDDVERAMTELREAHRVEPEGNDAALFLARLHFARGEWRDAYGFAQRHLVKRGFTGPEGHLVAARAAVAAGEYEMAVRTLKDLASRDGQQAVAALELARVERAAKGPAAAARELEQAKLDLADPAHAEHLRLLVLLLLEAGEAERARERLDALVAAQPDRAHLWVAQGELRLALGDLDGASAALERARQLDAEAPGLQLGLANLALQRGQADQVAAVLGPDAADADDAEAAFLLARARFAEGRSAEAREILVRLLRKHPEHPGAANDLAWILAEEGQDLDRALELAERAVRVQPTPEALDTLGWVRFRRGDTEASIEAFRQALAKRPDLATAQYHLGLALASHGESTAAAEAFRSALASGPFPEAEATRAALAKLEGGGGEERP